MSSGVSGGLHHLKGVAKHGSAVPVVEAAGDPVRKTNANGGDYLDQLQPCVLGWAELMQ